MVAIAATIISHKNGEFQVKAYDRNGQRMPHADYFTDDKADAKLTARAMVGNVELVHLCDLVDNAKSIGHVINPPATLAWA